MPSGTRGLIVQYTSSSDEEAHDFGLIDDAVNGRDDGVSGDSLLPPSPVGEPDPYVQENIRQCIEHQRKGFNFNTSLKTHESFSNPYIFETVAKVYSIDENGTNMLKHVFDPKRWQREDFYQELSRKRAVVEANQQEAMRQRLAVQQRSAMKPDVVTSQSAKPVTADPQVQIKLRKQQEKIAQYLAKK